VTPLKEALTVLADVLAKRPAEEILFDWVRSGRLVGELSVLIKRRHPEVQAELIASTKSIWRSSAKGNVTRHRKTIDCGKADTAQHPPPSEFGRHRQRVPETSAWTCRHTGDKAARKIVPPRL
jgi:hypothetical protein